MRHLRWCARSGVFLRGLAPSIPLAAGIAVGQALLWFLPPTLIAPLMIMVGGAIMVKPRWINGALPGALCGVLTAYVFLAVHGAPLVSEDAQVLLRVEGMAGHRSPGEITFVGREVLGEQQRLVRVRAVDLPWRNAAHIRSGDLVWVRGVAVAVPKPLNPFAWDAWLWRRGVSGEIKAEHTTRSINVSREAVEATRDELRRIVDTIALGRRGGALFLSMAFGFRDVLSAPVERLFSTLGLSHLLVVSGYQISLVFSVLFSVLMRLSLVSGASLMIRNAVALLSLALAGGYVALVGWEMSAVRAFIAAISVCGALALHREQRFAQRWGVALVAMQLVWPWALFEVGVILTFLALAGIGVGSTLAGKSGLKTVVLVTGTVWLLTTAFLVAWSGSLSWGGLVLNLLLAGPWSIINCTFGIMGLVLAVIAVPHSEWVLRGVFWVNEGIVNLLFLVLDACGGGLELEDEARWCVVLLLTALSVLLVVKAARLSEVRRGQSLAR